jgi:hypothetical protein
VRRIRIPDTSASPSNLTPEYTVLWIVLGQRCVVLLLSVTLDFAEEKNVGTRIAVPCEINYLFIFGPWFLVSICPERGPLPIHGW